MPVRVKSFLLFFLLCAGLTAFGEIAVTFYGGAGQVGGSCALVESGGFRMLVDCGTAYGDGDDRVTTNAQTGGVARAPTPLQQGRGGLATTGKSAFAFDSASIDCILLTHAHQDHAGRVPEIAQAGFRGTFWSTEPTRDLLALVWPSQLVYDESTRRVWLWSAKAKGGRARKVHWRTDCEWAEKISAHNRRSFTGTRAELDAHVAITLSACRECLEKEVEALVARFRTVPYETATKIGPFSVTFRPVKHIPGASAIYIAEGTNTLVFSGDLGTYRSHLVREIKPACAADAVFIESTYGDASGGGRDAVDAEYARFRKEVGDTVRKGGLAWVPAFALDRTQRVFYEIAQGMAKGDIPADAPVYMLSSTARNVMKAYLEHPEWNDVDIRTAAPLFARTKPRFTPSKHVKGGGILLTTSGMMDAGASAGLLPDLATNPAVRVCLVGYQSPGTHGHSLRSGAKEITVGGQEVPVRCAVSSYSCFGGHGDAAENDAWLANNHNARIFLIHGDGKALAERKKGLATRFGATVEVVEPFKRYVFPMR